MWFESLFHTNNAAMSSYVNCWLTNKTTPTPTWSMNGHNLVKVLFSHSIWYIFPQNIKWSICNGEKDNLRDRQTSRMNLTYTPNAVHGRIWSIWDFLVQWGGVCDVRIQSSQPKKLLRKITFSKSLKLIHLGKDSSVGSTILRLSDSKVDNCAIRTACKSHTNKSTVELDFEYPATWNGERQGHHCKIPLFHRNNYILQFNPWHFTLSV